MFPVENFKKRVLRIFYACRRLLKVPTNCRYVIVDDVFAPIAYRDAIARALFEHPSLAAPSICFVPSPIMHLVPFNAFTALVIDVGVDECILYPVNERMALFSDYEATPRSTAQVELRIEELMLAHGRVVEHDGGERRLSDADLEKFRRQRCAEQIAFRFCFVTTRERGQKLQQNCLFALRPHLNFFFSILSFADADKTTQYELPPPPVRMAFGTEQLLVPGYVRSVSANFGALRMQTFQRGGSRSRLHTRHRHAFNTANYNQILAKCALKYDFALHSAVSLLVCSRLEARIHEKPAFCRWAAANERVSCSYASRITRSTRGRRRWSVCVDR